MSRGHFCPKEHRYLKRFVDLYPDLKVAYTRIVTISTDTLLEANEFRYALGAEWPFLCDLERRVQENLDIAEYTDPQHRPMIPHTFVLEPCLRIFSIYEGYWYWGRPSPSELWHDLREVTRKIRPDWTLSNPNLRSAWEKGEKDQFWPYGKSLEEVVVSWE